MQTTTSPTVRDPRASLTVIFAALTAGLATLLAIGTTVPLWMAALIGYAAITTIAVFRWQVSLGAVLATTVRWAAVTTVAVAVVCLSAALLLAPALRPGGAW